MDLKMEVYTPDLSLIGVLEIFNAVLWDRKAFSSGSFSIDSLITDESRTLLVPENIIWIDGDTAGIIEHIEQQAGEEGPYITAKGRDLTGILDRRILWGQYDMSGTVPDIMRRLVDDCCIHPSRGDVAENRVIPGLVLEIASPAGGASVRVQKTGGTLLEALEELGEAFQTAFGVRFNPEVPQMEFWARPGINRSVGQNVNDPVFYSTELDDVLSSEYAYDSSNFRCVALVAGEGEGNDRSMVTVVNEIEEPPKPPEPPEPEKYTITLAVEPEGGGTVTGGGQFDAGRSVTVRAAASSGYAFAGWQENGETVSTEEAYTFQVRGDRTLTAVFASMAPREFSYTGDVVAVTLYPGLYKLEVWGAEGGYRSSAVYAGKGGYSVGSIRITQPTPVFVRVGGSGNTGGTAGGFNGGGRRGTYNGGGGASDIRIGADDLNHRVIVAGGGGSDGGSVKSGKYGGGRSGGDVGASGSTNGYGTAGYGGTQTGNSGGTSWIAQEQSAATINDADAKSGFGFGGNGVNKNGGFGGAGGGGWYGGTGRIPDSSGDDDGGGAGGSGFVWTGENAPAGFGLTEEHYLANAQTVDGAQSFTSPGGAAETGHSGNGYARITPVVTYTITTLTQDAAHGTVTGGGAYENGSQVTVTAAPVQGYKFMAWMEGGAEVSTDASYTFTVTSSRTLTAVFMEIPVYTISASIDPAGSGTVTGAGQYQEGETVTLTASPEDGYQFSAWKEAGQTVSEDEAYTFTAASNRTLVASFVERVSRLPEGYTELKYIQLGPNNTTLANFSAASCRTDQTVEIVFEIVKFPESAGSSYSYRPCLLYSKYVSNNTSYSRDALFLRKDGLYANASSGNMISSNEILLSSDMTVPQKVSVLWDGPNKQISINGGTPKDFAVYGVGSNWLIGTDSSGASVSDCWRVAAARIFSLKITSTGSTSSSYNKDYVPAKNSSGRVGLYDLLNDRFIYHASLIAGPAV